MLNLKVIGAIQKSWLTVFLHINMFYVSLIGSSNVHVKTYKRKKLVIGYWLYKGKR